MTKHNQTLCSEKDFRDMRFPNALSDVMQVYKWSCKLRATFTVDAWPRGRKPWERGMLSVVAMLLARRIC